MKLIEFLKARFDWVVGLAVLALGAFAVTRVRSARKASNAAAVVAEELEANQRDIAGAAKKAVVARERAVKRARKADAIKETHQARLRKLETERGSSTARDIADRLSRL